jgi:UDP-4-amino-4-deoxy-L-arabinose formyltransferase/UDP-glucuronic acid dehydrogenase (UDP-4-keto-hexauronic acid decarboxylating)
VILGKNELAAGCLRVVLDAGDEVALAVADPGDSGVDGWQPSFKRAAESLQLPVRVPANVNDPGFVSEVEALGPDFILSFQAAQILRPPLIATGSMGALNLHFGPLPRYRGVAPVAWAIINGEVETGVTLHRIEPGIDSGAVVASLTVPIGPDDTGRSLYDKCTTAGIRLFTDSWPRIRLGDFQPRAQSPDEALYYNRYSIDFSQRTVRWDADAKATANWVRAFIFPPFQYPVVHAGTNAIEVGAVSWDRGPHAGRPGSILAIEDEAILVAAPGGRVRLGQLRHDAELLRPEDFERLGLTVGATLT